ncbi:MAG: type IX secretion system membrane protein PorP/SprF [Bacteroidales bacterium]|nr:type IX secretion system membrane protein PorP/SprF [Bacteroidales bacterium]
MDNFDKILKQKIEQFPFEYDPSDWNGVLQKQKSASAGFSLLTKILFSVFLLLFVSSAVFYSINRSGERLSVKDSNEIVNIKIEDKEIVNKQIGNIKIEDKEIVNKQIGNIKIEDKEIVSKEIVGKQIEGKEIAGKEIEEKQIVNIKIEDKEIVGKEIAAKQIEEKKIVNAKIDREDIEDKQLENTVENFNIQKEPILENIEKKQFSEVSKNNADLQTTISIKEAAGKEIAGREIEGEKIEGEKIEGKEIEGKEIAGKEIARKEIVEKEIGNTKIDKKEQTKDSYSNITVNGVVQNSENTYQQSGYIPENQAVVLGEARMKSNYSFAVLKKSLDHYLSISQIGLERARDIVVHLNNQFLNDASLSGFEGRYTLSSSINVAAITENLDELNHIPYEFLLTNSFPIKSKQMGVGIAFQQIRGTNYNTLLFNVSIAKQFTLSRNNTLLIGGGINTSSIDKLDMVGPDYPWTQSPNLINKENQLLSLNLGMRFIHKSIYASISTSSLYRYAFTKDIHNSINPFTLHFATGGRLRLNGKWSLNPSVNYNFIAYNSHSYLTPYFSFSKQNKIYFGVHSENFNSVGAHFGFQAFQRLDCYMRAGYSLNEELKSLYGPIHYTEIGIKLGIGQFQK